MQSHSIPPCAIFTSTVHSSAALGQHCLNRTIFELLPGLLFRLSAVDTEYTVPAASATCLVLVATTDDPTEQLSAAMASCAIYPSHHQWRDVGVLLPRRSMYRSRVAGTEGRSACSRALALLIVVARAVDHRASRMGMPWKPPVRYDWYRGSCGSVCDHTDTAAGMRAPAPWALSLCVCVPLRSQQDAPSDCWQLRCALAKLACV
jgi:hypothetical protein